MLTGKQKKLRRVLSSPARKEMLTKAVGTYALFIRGDIALNAPVDTGYLQQHIESKPEGVTAVVLTEVPYAPYPNNLKGRKRKLKRTKEGFPPYWTKGEAEGRERASVAVEKLLTRFTGG